MWSSLQEFQKVHRDAIRSSPINGQHLDFHASHTSTVASQGFDFNPGNVLIQNAREYGEFFEVTKYSFKHVISLPQNNEETTVNQEDDDILDTFL